MRSAWWPMWSVIASMPPAVNDLRSFLKERLPDYMVPSVFMLLDSSSYDAQRKGGSRRAAKADQMRPEMTERICGCREMIWNSS